MSLAINDMLSPALRKKLAAMQDKRPALEAAGAALASVSTRSFRDESLRPAPWPALKPSTLRRRPGGQPLIDTGTLFRSISAQDPDRDSVEVGTDREYALYHQYGTSKMDARPFFPVTENSLTPEAQRAVESAVRARVNALLK